jgi:hypothetical protein
MMIGVFGKHKRMRVSFVEARTDPGLVVAGVWSLVRWYVVGFVEVYDSVRQNDRRRVEDFKECAQCVG